MALPADVAALAADRRRAQQSVAARVWALIRPMWARIDPAAVLPSWDGAAARPVLTVMTGGQLAAAAGAQAYVAAVLQAQAAEPDPVGTVAGSALAGVASDGRDLATLLRQPAQDTVGRMAAGMRAEEALRQGLGQLERIVFTQTADAGRVADGVAIANDRTARGYVRMLTPPSCSRCVVLAGKWFATNAGFQRHPRCDCRHVPAAENVAGHWTTSPSAYFRRLSAAEQDQVFTGSGARAIRNGADIRQVVNARKGALGLTPAGNGRLTDEEKRALRGGRDRGALQTTRAYGRDVYTTTEGVTTRGVAGARLGARESGTKTGGSRYRRARVPRLMPEQIYLDAGGDRDEAVRLLKRFGYIL